MHNKLVKSIPTLHKKSLFVVGIALWTSITTILANHVLQSELRVPFQLRFVGLGIIINNVKCFLLFLIDSVLLEQLIIHNIVAVLRHT